VPRAGLSGKTFIDTYDPSVLRRVQYMLYEIKWSNNKRPQQSCCHRTGTKHAEIYFLEDVFRKERSDPSAHCFITWFMSWSPCGYCCKEIRGFLKDQPNVNLVIYVARIYWHKREINLLGLRSLMNIGVWDMEHFSSRSLVPIQPWSVAMDGSMEVIEVKRFHNPFYVSGSRLAPRLGGYRNGIQSFSPLDPHSSGWGWGSPGLDQSPMRL
uniref:CMP/dCMP-type deaminase domain-containing protein n=1 Tax=Chelonoidis abingdonii TaxID=106734 RepID=A0A8C0H505_CHEAB